MVDLATDAPTRAEPGPARCASTGVSMTFPDGTRALDDDVVRRSQPGEFVTVVGPSGCGKSHPAAHRVRARPRHRRHRRGRPARASATCSRTPRCCRGAPCSATSSCSPSCTACPRPSAARRRRGHRAGRPARLRGEVPEAAVRRHADARLAGPLAGARPEGVPVRRAVRRARRDHPRAAERRAAAPVPAASGSPALFITHSHQRGGVPVDARARDVAPARAASSASSRCRSPYPRQPGPPLRPAFAELSGEVSHALREAHA